MNIEAGAAPPPDCDRCPRLASFRNEQAAVFPDGCTGPVPSFGTEDARLLIVGLAPGLRGANRTGRPFTGDYAGDLLYATLSEFGFARGHYDERPDDGLELIDCRITNAVRCVPPENKPTPAEQKTCRPFLVAEIGAMPRLKSILALGRVAHEAVLTTLGLKKSLYPFVHGAVYSFDGKLSLTDCYHCSRYNINTGRLTEAMFHTALEQAIKAARTAS